MNRFLLSFLFSFVFFLGCSTEKNDSIKTQVQLRDLALACIEYESANRRFPSQKVDPELHKKVGTFLSWRVQILPFLGKDAAKLYTEFHHDEPWDSPHNMKIAERMPDVYKSQRNNLEPAKTLFAFPTISVAAFENNPKMAPFGAPGNPPGYGNITDGSSNTIMIIEMNPDAAVVWTAPRDWEFNPDAPMTSIGETWTDGIMVAFADGSTNRVSNRISDEDFSGLITRAGGEIIDLNRWLPKR